MGKMIITALALLAASGGGVAAQMVNHFRETPLVPASPPPSYVPSAPIGALGGVYTTMPSGTGYYTTGPDGYSALTTPSGSGAVTTITPGMRYPWER